MKNNETTHDESCDCGVCRLETKAGLGVLAGAVITAGAVTAYLYGTEHGRKQRRALRSWMSDMRDEVVEHIEDLQYVDKQTYFDVIDDVVSRYKHSDEIDVNELVDFARDMKGHYHTIQREIKEGKSPKSGSTKSTATKTPSKKTKSKSGTTKSGATRSSTKKSK